MAIAVVPPQREDKWDKWMARALVAILVIGIVLGAYQLFHNGFSF